MAISYKTFQKKVYDYYRAHKRKLPWRNTKNPYFIFVSEIMLQQTQAPRVIEKYSAFIKKFPTVQTLAKASFTDVMRLWQGLGYNRRALNMHRAAKQIVKEYNGVMPSDTETLKTLPGIGAYTAAAICIFAYNKPEICIETNIRSVFIHHFFKSKENINDSEILKRIEKTLDRKHPRAWYEALMDYGFYLKQVMENPSRKSKTHMRQSAFRGSNREVRGAIVRELSKNKRTPHKLQILLPFEMEKIQNNVESLIADGLITKRGKVLSLV